ncbi:hypothetical protein OJJOAM_002203 [Cupriavidus sp. H18C1]|uniref:pentapeptide repeat-containing protein n=1 Tax=Cupriavidus sp. H18C1 TaxID=3241601 RepID=UPI003BB94DD8
MNNQKDYFKINGFEKKSYSGTHILDAGGKKVHFKDCNFSYCIIERGYFHDAKFENCTFTGTRFISCNFRSATFANCDFSYATFFTTIVSEEEIAKNLPDQPNKRRDLVRTLRANAASMGNQEASNSLLSLELRANTEHYRRMHRDNHSYYSKYSRAQKIEAFFKYWGLRLEEIAWGYGLSPIRLVLWLLLILFFCGVAMAISGPGDVVVNAALLSRIGSQMLLAAFAVLDLALIDSEVLDAHRVIFGFLVAVRVIILGLFITVIYRRYAR